MVIKKNLFNWIGDLNILNKNCLDLFAGTGNLSFELISRYSKNVYSLEINKFLFKNLIKFKKKFKLKNIFLFNFNVLNYIYKFKFNIFFDFIFLDPPYKDLKFLIKCLKIYINLLNKNALIYIETLFDYKLILDYFSHKFIIFKKDKIGKINYFLFKFI